MQAGKHGSFLARFRQSAANQFALSVRLDDDVLHVVVVYQVSRLLATFDEICRPRFCGMRAVWRCKN